MFSGIAAAALPRSSDFDPQLEAPELRYEAVSDDLCRFDRYPPYLMMKRRETALFSIGLKNPYFPLGDGVAGAEIIVEGRRCINYASYNYLDLAGDRRVNEAAVAAIARYGTSVSASRLASGERPIHRELEAEQQEQIAAQKRQIADMDNDIRRTDAFARYTLRPSALGIRRIDPSDLDGRRPLDARDRPGVRGGGLLAHAS